MRAPRSVTVQKALVVLSLAGLSTAGCATQVHAHGEVDPAATISTSAAPTTDSPLPTTTSDSPTPTSVDTDAERRITCLLVTPSVAKAISDWNNFVDHKSGTRTSVATSLTGSATTIETVLRTSRIAANDQIRGWGGKLAVEMRAMAAALRRGATPTVDKFNGYKRKLQAACPKD